MLDKVLYFLTITHFVSLGCIALYGIHRLWLILQLIIERKRVSNEKLSIPSNHPYVTVQLPIYNEKFVARRLINSVANIRWPVDRFEIQILDDSTDETKEIVESCVGFWRRRGLNIYAIRRENRSGFKAGALFNGIKQAKGEFIAIFDADFIPGADFLYQTIPYFLDSRVGMVQARWSFLNDNHSWLTKIQSVFLGQHFSIEHFIRFRKNLFFNFNGTAGIWRKKAIESSGGWQSDTVTEDLDLSYRAQMAGWRFVYLDKVCVPSELPVTVADLRNQQQRWAKGSVQTAKKILPGLLFSNFSFSIKREAIVHLLSNMCWLLGTIATITLYPAIIFRKEIGLYQILYIDLPLFITSGFAFFIYFISFCKLNSKKINFRIFFLIPILTVGIAPSISISIISGIFSKGGNFIRTPKYGITGKVNISKLNFVYKTRSYRYVILNTILFIYTLMPVISAFQRHTFLSVPFLLIFPMGFVFIIFRELIELRN